MKRHRSKERRQVRKHGLYYKFKKFFSGFAMLFLIITFALPLFAEEAEKPKTEGPGEKLVEGIGEIATGWAEVPKEMAETSKEKNPIEGATVGTIKGAGEAVVKTTEGAVKTATFYIPEEKKEGVKE